MAIELDNTFTVPVPPEHAWDVLLDVERIAPCMPGASVLSVDGDSVEGQVKVKLGALSVAYKGTAKFVEKDQANHTIVIDASGKETRGSGTASASVNAVLKPGDKPGTTTATIHTSLNITGRAAQMGRGLLPEISGKLIAQFADNLAALIAADSVPAEAGDDAPAEDAATDSAGTPASATANGATAKGSTATANGATGPEAAAAAKPVATKTAPAAPKQEESLDAFKFVVVPVLKRVIPVAAVGAALAVVVRKLLRRGRKS
jgi:carbon monoxide dehydrogenase subunit G